MIAILLPNLCGGGAERVSIDLARAFKAAGHQVEFVLMSGVGDFLTDAKRDFSVVDLGVTRTRNLIGPLARYLRSRRPAALIANMWPLTAIAPIARKLSGADCRVLVAEHGILSAQYATYGKAHRAAMRASMAISYRLADARVGVSTGVARDMASLAKMPLSSCDVVYNPVPARATPSQDDMAKAEAMWTVPRGRRVVHVGRLKPVKNQALLLQAFSQIPQNATQLMLVGNGDLEPDLRSQAAALGITDSVVFAGFQTDPTPFYTTADLFVLSSNAEGFGNVIVEAMACGTPVVCTDCPSGPAEILENGRYGQLVPMNDVAALANAIQTGLAAPDDPLLLQRRAAAFTPDIAARRYLALLDITEVSPK